MHDHPQPAAPEPWVVWNGTFGILATATLGRVEPSASGRTAWMDKPFDMIGPFNLDELEARGRIAFEACIVMSRQRWQEDQVELRRESQERRRAAQQRHQHEHARHHTGRGWRHQQRGPHEERQHRETLNLPTEGQLEPRQIKTAYRRLAQKAHPDVGGSHEQFLRITEARNALLGRDS